ncbi:hypothetical protein NDN08_007284 [Rhodosorus marinus]|uniref:SAC domain-containing protein n=1 Tax=Rhodosorus marinus TaxID=101924 RepID=A0AAV8UIS8_9RHOD|nr:hypothetical protein NDN08_007284 [Rhodosorus marinus]
MTNTLQKYNVIRTYDGVYIDSRVCVADEDGLVKDVGGLAPPENRVTDQFEIFCVFGYISGLLILVTGVESLGSLNGHQVLKVTEWRTINVTSKVEYCENAVRSFFTLDGMYFSPTTDLSKRRSPSGSTFSEVQKMAFCWNHAASSSLVKAGFSEYVRPMVFGFVSITSVRDIKLALVSRRRTDRAGFRFTTRGMDSDGAVAIATETEAFVERAGVVTSFTTIRGSIPLFWMQFPLQMRKPKTMIHTGSREERAAFSTHFQKLSEEYGSRVVILSTVNDTGAEGILNLKYSREARRSENVQLFKHFRFFSGETAPVTQRLDDLYKDLKGVLSAQGLTQRTDHEIVTRKAQSGVLRINCIDCCDRSNVAQAHLVNSVIREFVLDDLNPDEWNELEVDLRELWHENGKQISEQYAGGAALQGDLTRYGMRTFSGRCQDLKSLVNRDLSNRYKHGTLQDGLDLILGVVKEHDPIHPDSRIRPYFPRIVIIIFLVAFVCKNLNLSRGLSVAFKLLSAMSFGGLLLVMSMPEAWTLKSALGGTKARVHPNASTFLPLE